MRDTNVVLTRTFFLLAAWHRTPCRGTISIMASAQQRDTVHRLFITHFDELRSFVAAVMPDPDMVDDVLHTTFKAMTSRAGEYDPSQRFSSWATTIARHKIVQMAERVETAAQPFSPEVLEVLAGSHVAIGLNEERLRALEKCVATLAPQTRRIVELRYRSAMRPCQIAQVLGWTNASVRVALSRARTVLRTCLESHATAMPEG